MQLTQYTDAQLMARLDQVVPIYLASCNLDHDFIDIETFIDNHYAEAERRGVFS